jgi:hypothetical protein
MYMNEKRIQGNLKTAMTAAHPVAW